MINQETEKPALCLEDILQHELLPLFRVQHLNRPVLIGLIGDIGGGKSLGGGTIALLDYMLQGEPCWANMQLKATFEVDDETAGKYGLKGGPSTFEAKLLDKNKFLRFDPEYRNGVFFTHEFNIWLADSRRSQSNINLETDDLGQELRKLNSAWVYDCLHEMFVDVRIRDATDFFIYTSDTALTSLGMARKQPQGHEFKWMIYAMTQKGAAILRTEKYKESGKPLGPFYVKGKQLWGLIDTDKRERREKYKTQIGSASVDIELGKSPEMVAAESKWGWLYEKIKDLHDEGYEEIHDEELWEYLQLKERGFSTREVGKQLSITGIRKRQAPPSEGGYYYLINQFDLKKGILGEKKVGILAK